MVHMFDILIWVRVIFDSYGPLLMVPHCSTYFHMVQFQMVPPSEAYANTEWFGWCYAPRPWRTWPFLLMDLRGIGFASQYFPYGLCCATRRLQWANIPCTILEHQQEKWLPSGFLPSDPTLWRDSLNFHLVTLLPSPYRQVMDASSTWRWQLGEGSFSSRFRLARFDAWGYGALSQILFICCGSNLLYLFHL